MEIIDQQSNDLEERGRSIEEVLQQGYEFNFGEYLSRMFNLFGKTFGFLLGHSGIMMISYILLYLLLFIFFFASITDFFNESFVDSGRRLDENDLIPGIISAFLLLSFYLVGWVMPFRAGIYTFLMRGRDTGKYEFRDFFEAIRSKWAKLVGLLLITHLMAGAMMIFANILLFQDLWMDSVGSDYRSFGISSGSIGLLLFAYVPMIYVLVSASLSVPLILFKTDSVIEAFVSSLKIVTKKWFLFLGLYIIIYFLTVSGVFLCGFGFLISMHCFPILIYCIYEDIFIRQQNKFY